MKKKEALMPLIEKMTHEAADDEDLQKQATNVVRKYAGLLPAEGPGSRRAFALWCFEQIEGYGDRSISAVLMALRRFVAAGDNACELNEVMEMTWAAEAFQGIPIGRSAARTARYASVVPQEMDAIESAASWAAHVVHLAEGARAAMAMREAQIAALVQLVEER